MSAAAHPDSPSESLSRDGIVTKSVTAIQPPGPLARAQRRRRLGRVSAGPGMARVKRVRSDARAGRRRKPHRTIVLQGNAEVLTGSRPEQGPDG